MIMKCKKGRKNLNLFNKLILQWIMELKTNKVNLTFQCLFDKSQLINYKKNQRKLVQHLNLQQVDNKLIQNMRFANCLSSSSLIQKIGRPMIVQTLSH